MASPRDTQSGAPGAAATRVLVVAPATVVPVWLAEFRKFLGTEAPAIVTADGDSRALSVAEVLRRLATTSAPLVAVISYEAMKLCVHASLLNSGAEKLSADRVFRPWPERPDRVLELSGKLQAAAVILTHILTRTRGKVVVASSFKMPLVIIANWIRSRTSVRVAGSPAATGPPAAAPVPEHHDPSRWRARRLRDPREGRASWLGDLLDAKLRIRETLALSGAAAEGSDGDDDDDDAMVSEDAPLVTTAANTPLVSFVFTSMEQLSAPLARPRASARQRPGAGGPGAGRRRRGPPGRAAAARRPRRAAPRRDELLDELMAADAGSTPPPPCTLAAVHAEPTVDLRGPEFLARARREADAARPVLVEDEDGAVAELEGATEGVEDHFARAERAVLALLHDDPAFRDAGPADRDKADLVVGLLFQPSIESELDVRRRAADFQDLHHDLRAAIRLAVREASARTTADDERDVLGDGAQTLEHLAVMT
ncbi:hypothetical protein JL721_4865 [Aureococcus anophagefferens]|nr:hypothetical protein JL721_4865 [Aureococcus anophagefferens]